MNVERRAGYRRRLGRAAGVALALLASAAHAFGAEALPAGRYVVRSGDSYVGYRITKLGAVPVRGHFAAVAGEIVLDPRAPERSRAVVRVPVTSLEAGDPRRTETLLSDDFFAASRHPHMSFVSRRVQRHADGRWLVSGSLTIRGVTRTVTLPVELRRAEGIEGPVLILSAALTIDRRDFGVLGERWSAGRAILSDAVDLELTLTAEPRREGG